MKSLESLQVLVNGLKKQIQLEYLPKTKQAFFDICDLSGRVIYSGSLFENGTIINISDLLSKKYILLIIDGDNAISKKFQVA